MTVDIKKKYGNLQLKLNIIQQDIYFRAKYGKDDSLYINGTQNSNILLKFPKVFNYYNIFRL